VTVELARAGGVVGALGLALLMLAPWRGLRLLGLGAWAGGCLLLGLWLAVPGHEALYAIASATGALGAVLGALLFLRLPWALPLAVLACVPLQVQVSIGATTAHVLVPLYVVVAAAALALAWRLYWETGRGRELGLLAWPLALLVGWSGLALLWSDDPRRGATVLLFFVLPFGLLAVALSRLRWRPFWAGVVYAELAVLGTVFAGIGLWQYATREEVVSPDADLVPSSWYHPVDSVFRDPSLYGRFLVVAILAGAVVVLFGRRRAAWAAALAVLVTFAGLVPSFSHSSYAALAVGIVAALAVAWGRLAIVPLAAAAVAVALVVVALPDARDRVFAGDGVSHAASERWDLVSDGLELARNHPLAGVGLGGFREASAALGPRAEQADDAAPVTIAAELGAPGLVLSAWLAIAAALVLVHRRATDDATRRGRLVVGLALLAIGVQSLFHGALLETPLTWALLGLLAAASARAAPAPAPRRSSSGRPRADRVPADLVTHPP
jgi:hypothetical protein